MLNWEKQLAFYDARPLSNRWKIISYGQSKTGKTFFINSLPAPVFVIDTDGSLRGLANPHVLTLSITREEAMNGMPIYDTVDDIITKLYRKEGPFEKATPASFVLDGETALADLLAMELVKSSNVGTKSRNPITDKVERDEYGVLAMQMETLHGKMDALTQNIYLTAGVRIDTDNVSGKVSAMPDILGSFRQRVGHNCDAVLFMESEENKFYAYTRPHARYPAGIRLWVGPERIENPTFDKIFREPKYFLPRKESAPAPSQNT
jgi:hypothetical protein